MSMVDTPNKIARGHPKRLSTNRSPSLMRTQRWGWLLVVLIIFYLAIEIASYRNITAFSYFLFTVGLTLLVIDLRTGILFYVAVCLLSTDTPRMLILEEFSSVHTVSIGGLTLMPYWTLAVFGCVVVNLMLRGDILRFRMSEIDRLMMYLGMLFLASALRNSPSSVIIS